LAAAQLLPEHELLHQLNGEGRIHPLGADIRAGSGEMAAESAVRGKNLLPALGRPLVAAVRSIAPRLGQRLRAEKTLVGRHGRTGGQAGAALDAVGELDIVDQLLLALKKLTGRALQLLD